MADVFGGFPIDKQIQTLRQKTHIVVGTPGRLMDHIRRGTIVLDEIQAIVVDEADLMLDMGFIDEVKDILSLVPPVCQQMIFSATLGDRILDFIGDQIKDAVTLCEEISEHEVLDISESYIMTDSDEKYGTLRNILIMENPDRCMIFCGTKEMVNVLCRKLRRDGVRCGMIHGDMDQQARLRAVDEFRSGRIRYFIVTDVVARGIDFENLTHVINYDYPTGKQTYVHRIGRTGRNGKTGVAVSLVTPDETSMVKQVERYRGQSVEFRKRERPSKEQEKSFLSRQQEKIAREKSKASGFRRTISKLTIGGGRKSKMRAVDIVGTLCNLRDVSSDDIGAIDIRDSITYVEILNGKGDSVCNQLQDRPIKGKVRKVRISR